MGLPKTERAGEGDGREAAAARPEIALSAALQVENTKYFDTKYIYIYIYIFAQTRHRHRYRYVHSSIFIFTGVIYEIWFNLEKKLLN